MYAIIYWIEDLVYPLTYKTVSGEKVLRLFAKLSDADSWASEMETNPFNTLGIRSEIDCRVIDIEGVKE